MSSAETTSAVNKHTTFMLKNVKCPNQLYVQLQNLFTFEDLTVEMAASYTEYIALSFCYFVSFCYLLRVMVSQQGSLVFPFLHCLSDNNILLQDFVTTESLLFSPDRPDILLNIVYH